MEPIRILVLNGPNLGVLGRRQPEIYGERTLQDLPGLLREVMGDAADAVQLVLHQSNSEGGLIDRLERAVEEGIQGIAFNAGAYTHTSLALADCLAWIGIPCVEVHLSNVWARREPLRHQSMIAPQCVGVVSGFGLLSYVYAVQAIYRLHVRDKAGTER
ncbi:MAG: 3-dehydroquinate dehydratase [Desulfohalobiaceae bacterium]|nr:3-dehydroquinate dehydratase [Desulfohalobiaceae bacterium]